MASLRAGSSMETRTRGSHCHPARRASAPHRVPVRMHCPPLTASISGRGGGLLERPSPADVGTRGGNYDSGRDTNAGGGGGVATDTGRGSTTRDRQKVSGGGNYRVLLLGSDAHTEARVVRGIVAVVPQADESFAKECFATSEELGQALLVTCLKEHAEHYRQQLFNMGLRTAMEPDTSTK